MTERDKKIIDLYLNHLELSNKQIAEQFGISVGTVSRIARINNLPRRTGNTGVRLSNEQIREIQTKYLNSTPKIILQKEYNISYDRLQNILKDCANISSAKRLNPNLKENYFSNIDSNEKAYWLGWIISDGAITYQPKKSKFQLALTIKKSDEDILHLLEQDLGVENKVYDSQNGKYKRFNLSSKNIILDLVNLGINQNKSLNVKVPIFDKKYNAAFIRGLFDGDGGFTHYTRSSGQICNELSFCGNIYIISWIRQTLLEEIPNLTANTITKEGNIKRIRWSRKKDITLIRDYLYKDCDLHFLSRKYNLIYANTEPTC